MSVRAGQAKGRGVPVPVLASSEGVVAGAGDLSNAARLLPVQPSVYLSTADADTAASIASGLMSSDRWGLGRAGLLVSLSCSCTPLWSMSLCW